MREVATCYTSQSLACVHIAAGAQEFSGGRHGICRGQCHRHFEGWREHVHRHLLWHTFACLYHLRYRDPLRAQSTFGHMTVHITKHWNHNCEVMAQMNGV